MIVSSRYQEHASQTRYDVCIIGAGPAGLVVASELAFSNLKVCVLESGSETPSKHTQSLQSVLYDKLSIKDESRVRVIGGAGTVWGGLSAPLDPIDLEERPWSVGWPLPYSELEHYYQAAERYRFPELKLFNAGRGTYWDLPGLEHKMFAAVRPPFDFSRLRTIFSQSNVDLFINTTATHFSKKGENTNTHIDKVLCKTKEGEEVTITARYVVLAAGAIENVRMLLHTNVGNEYDQVGRYFMNHPKGYAGYILLRRPLSTSSCYLPRAKHGRLLYAGLRLKTADQQRSDLLNSYVQLDLALGIFQRLTFYIWRKLPSRFNALFNILRPRKLRLRWYVDMEPRPKNRITLSSKKDENGIPLPHVSYSLGDRDRNTLKELFLRFTTAIKEQRIGVIKGTFDEVLEHTVDDASHHIGGTRMGTSPASSVVDADGRVHGVHNLYIGGSSVFPTAGSANPTYTIAALAIRLAEHLKKQIGESAGSSINEPTSSATALRVVVIGAGRRVSEDVIPAFESLPEQFTVTHVFAKHHSTLVGSSKKYDVQPLNTISQSVHEADVVYIAVPPEAMIDALKEIKSLRNNATLIIDTPVSRTRALEQECRLWNKVYVAEDSAFLPWLSLVDPHTVTHILCDQSVYRYHGIALLKKITNKNVSFALRLRSRLFLKLGRTTAWIHEPRAYEKGRLYINGSEPEMIIKDHTCMGFKFLSKEVQLSSEESQLAGYMEETDSIVTKMLALKRVGLRRFLIHVFEDKDAWSFNQGKDDAIIDFFVHRFYLFVRFFNKKF